MRSADAARRIEVGQWPRSAGSSTRACAGRCFLHRRGGGGKSFSERPHEKRIGIVSRPTSSATTTCARVVCSTRSRTARRLTWATMSCARGGQRTAVGAGSAKQRERALSRIDREDAREIGPLRLGERSAGRREQHEAAHLGRTLHGVVERDGAAERVADDDRRLLAEELLDHGRRRLEEGLGGERRPRLVAEAVPG